MPQHFPRHGLVGRGPLRLAFLLQGRQHLVERFNRRLNFATRQPTIALALRLAIDDAVERHIAGLMQGGLFEAGGRDANLIASQQAALVAGENCL
jgi:hypothetical protein